MDNDYGNGSRKIIDLTIQAERLTSDILKSALMDFLDHRTEKKGKMSISELEKHSGGKIESIEINEKNIGDFLETAKKYDIDFSVKRDTSTQPKTYHIFFAADKAENFQRAFTEYTIKAQESISQRKRGEMSREQVRQEAQRIAAQPRKKEKEREKTRENTR